MESTKESGIEQSRKPKRRRVERKENREGGRACGREQASEGAHRLRNDEDANRERMRGRQCGLR
eukprot:6210785-Pleurochrysis_carterae.AAC.1